MTIGIDIDDTLTNTRAVQEKCWQEYYKLHPKKGYNEKLPSSINDFGDEYVQIFWDTYRELLSFSCTFKDNVSYYLKKLKDENNTICVITSRPDYKYKNLKKRLNKWFKDNNLPIDIIYTNVRDKGLFCYENKIDLLIDDDIKHITSAINNKVKTILFNNNSSYHGPQTTTWEKAYILINKIKEEL